MKETISDFDKKILKVACQEHIEAFRKVEGYFNYGAENFDKPDSQVCSFIATMIGDYLYDLDERMLTNPVDELNRYYDGQVDKFLARLRNDLNRIQNAVVNCYKTYIDDEENLKQYAPEEMNDISLEYLMTGDMCEEVDLEQFSEKEADKINRYLIGCGLEPIIFHTNISFHLIRSNS